MNKNIYLRDLKINLRYMKKRLKKTFLITGLTILLFFIGKCEKPSENLCFVCETEVINVHYKKPLVYIETKSQTDTLCNQTFEQIRKLEGMHHINDTRDSVINIWSTNCYQKY